MVNYVNKLTLYYFLLQLCAPSSGEIHHQTWFLTNEWTSSVRISRCLIVSSKRCVPLRNNSRRRCWLLRIFGLIVCYQQDVMSHRGGLRAVDYGYSRVNNTVNWCYCLRIHVVKGLHIYLSYTKSTVHKTEDKILDHREPGCWKVDFSTSSCRLEEATYKQEVRKQQFPCGIQHVKKNCCWRYDKGREM